MSSHDAKMTPAGRAKFHSRRAVFGAMLLAPVLAGCGFQPLYGSGFSGGEGVAGKLRSVDIALIPGRVGQEVRNELIFKETGGRDPAPPRYRLEIALP